MRIRSAGLRCSLQPPCVWPRPLLPVHLPNYRKQIPSFDLTAIDKTIDPCVDFYQYACGNWMKNNPIPADKSRWGRFNELAEHNLYVLRDILDQAQAPGQHSAIEQKVGDYYAACMDESHHREAAAPRRWSRRWMRSQPSRPSRT